MSSGDGSTRKSLELLIQVSAWTGGILAAGVGGLLYAFVSKDTASEVIPYFKWVLVPLLIALAVTWWLQIHVALHARELEIKDAKAARKAAPTGAPVAVSPAPAQVPAPAEAAAKVPADDIDAEPAAKATRRGSINASIWIQAIAQTLALIMIGVVFLLYKGAKSEPESVSLLSSESDDKQISYLMKVRIPDEKDKKKSTSVLRLLVSEGGGNWRVCTIDPAAKGDQAQCPAVPPSGAGGPTLQLMGDPILFHRLQYKLKYEFERRTVDLTDQVCKAKQTILEAKAGGVLVVGSHDRARLVDGAAVDSNESLARLRASSVASFLLEKNSCGPAIETVISFNTAPVLATRELGRNSDLAADRSVRVYGLVTINPKH